MHTKSRLAAILLAFFLGLLGVHWFYLGKTGKGLIYLVLTITGIGVLLTSILTLIDFLSFCFMSDEKFESKFGKQSS